MAAGEVKLFGSAEKASSVQATAAIATATFAAAGATKQYCQQLMISASGVIAAAVRATLTYTFGGSVQTVGIQIPATTLATPIIVYFGPNPVEGDDNTAITLTVPSLGAGITGEATLIGFARQI